MKARTFVFTLHDPTPDDENSIQSWTPKYLIYGRETCPTTGRPHLQGYISFKNPRSWKSVKADFPERVHLEISRGTPQQNYNYCTKDNDYYEFGELPNPGQRTDIQNVKHLIIKENSNFRTILRQATSVQSTRMGQILLTHFEKPRAHKPQVFWFYGPSGTGKTRYAQKLTDPDNRYTSTSTIKWWDGYDAHPDVIIDDYRKNFSTFSDLLRLLDRYEYRIEYKGGYRQFKAKRIFITSPKSPQETWTNRTSEDLTQLLRRIDIIKCFPNKGTCLSSLASDVPLPAMVDEKDPIRHLTQELNETFSKEQNES